jgi:hypothetical protein
MTEERMNLWYRVSVPSIATILLILHSAVAQVREGVSTEQQFVRGQLTYVVSAPGVLRWDVGSKIDYLPFILNVESLSGSARVSITILDVDAASVKGEGLPSRILPQYYRITAPSAPRSFKGLATVTYSPADVATADIKPALLQVYQRSGERWAHLQTVSHDLERGAITVELAAFADIVIGEMAGPLYSFEPTSLNFGLLKARLVKRDSVLLRGLTLEAVGIDSAVSTNARFAAAPGPVTGDGRGVWLYVDFHPVEDQPEEAMVIVYRRGSDAPDTLTARGIGRAPVFVSPGPVLAFEETKVNRQTAGRIEIRNAGSDTMFVSARLTHQSFSLSPPLLKIAPLDGASFEVSFKPAMLGEHEGTIEFVHNAPGSTATMSVTGVGKAPLFSTAVSGLSFGNIPARTSMTRSVEIRNAGNDSLTIKRVFSSQPWVAASGSNVVIAPGDTASFAVAARVGESAGLRTGWIVFEHDAQSSPDSLAVEAVVTQPVEESEQFIPTEFFLANNYPNPFNPVTTIEYGIVEEAFVTLKVYTMLGVEVRTLASGFQTPGFYSVMWDAKNDRGQEVATGMYFYRLEAHVQQEGDKPFVQVRKMLFVK